MSTMSAADKKAFAAQREAEREKRQEEGKQLLAEQRLEDFDDTDDFDTTDPVEGSIVQTLYPSNTVGKSGKTLQVWRVLITEPGWIPGAGDHHYEALRRYINNHNLRGRMVQGDKYLWEFVDKSHAEQFHAAWGVTGSMRGGAGA